MNSSLKVFVKKTTKKNPKTTPSRIATPRKTGLKGIKNTLAGSLPAPKERCQGEEGGGPHHGLGGADVLDDVLRVDLVLLEDHEDRGVRHAVHAAVVEDIAKALFGRGADEGGVASDELPHQHPGQEHHVGLGVGFAVVVGICGVSGKVAPLAVGSTMKTTDPPVKVLLADGIDEICTGAMEQLPLIDHLPSASLLHLPFLPLVDFPKGQILDSLNLLNKVERQRTVE